MLLVPLDSQAAHQLKFASQSRLHHADHAHQANPVSQDLKDHPATPVHQAHPETLAKMDNQAAQVHKAHPVHQATQAPMAHEETLVPQLLAHPVPQETPAPLAQTDHPDLPDNPVHAVTMAPQVPQDPKAHLVQLAAPAKMALQATRDHPVQMAPRESPVFAPSTAPWTAVSSSKMAHGAKQPVSRPIISSFQSWPNGYGECLLLLAIHPYLFIFRSSN